MGNPLLAFWHLFSGSRPEDDAAEGQADLLARQLRDQGLPSAGRRRRVGSPLAPEPQGPPSAPAHTGAIFLILRRMRAPLILLITVLAVSVVGLTMIPGAQADGGHAPMGLFDAVYFVTFTATTIGFGELPDPLTTPQRLWVTMTIYWMVIGWAYAIGTLLSLVQDRNFRREVALQRFLRRVHRISDPFLILLGYGDAGAQIAHELDRRGRRLVVIDRSQDRIDSLDLAALRRDVPSLTANLRVSSTLLLLGLDHPRCAGVLALSDDDEANLAAVQTTHLLRPDISVVARADSREVADRMRAFGQPTVVVPFDALGDRLRVLLGTPALAQLFDWLVSTGGAPAPPRTVPPDHGRWVIVGAPRSSGEVAADLTAAGLPVVEIDPTDVADAHLEPQGEAFAALMADSVGLVAIADRETINVSYIQAARAARPDVFVVARQESAADDALFHALGPDLVLIPSQVVAREVLERLANPVLWDFLTAAGGQGDQWAAQTLEALQARTGPGSPDIWQAEITQDGAPALVRRLAEETGAGRHIRLGDLLGSPFATGEQLPVAVLMLNRGGTEVLMPLDEVRLAAGDVLLVASGPGARRAWAAALTDDTALDFVLTNAPQSAWWGHRLPGKG